MRGRGGFGGRPTLRPMCPLILGRRPFYHGIGCLGLFFPILMIGVFALMILFRFIW